MIRFIIALMFLTLPAQAGVLDEYESITHSMRCNWAMGTMPMIWEIRGKYAFVNSPGSKPLKTKILERRRSIFVVNPSGGETIILDFGKRKMVVITDDTKAKNSIQCYGV